MFGRWWRYCSGSNNATIGDCRRKGFVVAPEMEATLNNLKKSGLIHHIEQSYDEIGMQIMELVIAVTYDMYLNSRIAYIG